MEKKHTKKKHKKNNIFFFIKLAQSFFEFCFCGNIWLSIDKFIQIGNVDDCQISIIC